MGANSYHLHLHRRKKRSKKSSIDRLVYVAVILGPVMTLPQVWNVWVAEQPGVSVITWVAYSLIAVIWLLYGVRHREKPIIMLQLSWLLLDVLIVIGVLTRH